MLPAAAAGGQRDVSKRKVLNFLRIRKPRVASEISQCQRAGTGCGWCVSFLKKYFEQSRTGRLDPADRMIPAEYARQRGAYIRAGHGIPPAGATPPPDAAE